MNIFSSADDGAVREQRQAVARVQRNFWFLVAATVIAVGVLTLALKEPSRPATAVLVAVSGLAALASLTLAGRILVVMTTRRLPRHEKGMDEWRRRGLPLESP